MTGSGGGRRVYYSIEYIQQNIKVSFIYIFRVGPFQKKKKQRGVEKIYTFLEKSPGNFSFPTLPLEISDKTKLHLCWELHKIVLWPKTKNLGNSTQFALGHPW